jgi:hypothetical protein
MTIAVPDALSNSKVYQRNQQLLTFYRGSSSNTRNYRVTSTCTTMIGINCNNCVSNGCELTCFSFLGRDTYSLLRSIAGHSRRHCSLLLRCFCCVGPVARNPGAHGKITRWKGASEQKRIWRKHRSWGQWCVSCPITRVRSTKTPYHHILDHAKTCRTNYSGHADRPHDQPRPHPHTASPHRFTALPGITPGLASGTSTIRPARRDEHARGVGPQRNPCVHQLAHLWSLGCVLGTTREDGHTCVPLRGSISVLGGTSVY